MKQYTYPEIRKAVQMRKAGWHPKEIAHILKRSESAINRLLSVEKKKHGHIYPPIERRGLKWTNERIEAMAKDYPRKTYAALGKDHNLSAVRIAYLMAKRAQALHAGTWII